MAISRQKKEQTVEKLKAALENSAGVMVADNNGLTVAEATELRNKAREAGCTVYIAKNTLIKRTFGELGRGEGLGSYLVGPTILIIHEEDPVSPAKVFFDFAKAHEKLVIKAGMLQQEILDVAGVNHLAKLPGKAEIRSQFCGLVNGMVGVAFFSAQNMLQQFTGLVDAQKDKIDKAA